MMLQQFSKYFQTAYYISGIQRQIQPGLSLCKGHCLVERNTQIIMTQCDSNVNYDRIKMLSQPMKGRDFIF